MIISRDQRRGEKAGFPQIRTALVRHPANLPHDATLPILQESQPVASGNMETWKLGMVVVKEALKSVRQC